MLELVKSIENNGILSPLLVRPLGNGEYEIISGHRRKRACEIAGKEKVSAIIKRYKSMKRLYHLWLMKLSKRRYIAK